MNRRAWIYIWIIFVSGGALAFNDFRGVSLAQADWYMFAVLTGAATLAQLFKSEAPTHQLYHPALIFLLAGAIVLEPYQFFLLVAFSHTAEWIKERIARSNHLKAWYLQPFNIAMHTITGMGAWLVFNLFTTTPENLSTTHSMLGAGLAAGVYVLLNHLIVGQVLVLARGVTWKESEILTLENLSTDFVMLVMGFVIALLMQINVLLILPALAPLYLIYRALAVPYLKRQASTDPKTGLWNPKHFMEMFELELARSNRFDRPITIVLADLDLLRNINNAYGHLAGDAVLIGVAQTLKNSVREYDAVARFGGEEFAIMMPETNPEDAYQRIEDIRKEIEARSFEDPATHKQIKATMSFGITGGKCKDQTPREIIHRADVAVYQAKANGRNQTLVISADDPQPYDEVFDTGNYHMPQLEGYFSNWSRSQAN